MNRQLEAIVRQRISQAQAQIEHSLMCVQAGMPLAAETNTERLQCRLQRKAFLTPSEAQTMSLGIRSLEQTAPEARKAVFKAFGPEAIYGDTVDFVGVAFLERGIRAARTVARVAFRNGAAQGTGFMVSSRLFITNHHVIETALAAAQFKLQFEYETNADGSSREPSEFALAPDVFFLTDSIQGLDFTLIAVGEQLTGPHELSTFGWSRLMAATDKHALGEFANIVQHPDGRYKEVVLRENRLVSRLDLALHYVADTQPGSSGSPVFNTDWEAIALHHWGGPWIGQPPANSPQGSNINEGIRISAIVAKMQQSMPQLQPSQRELLQPVIEGRPSVESHAARSTPIQNGSSAPARIDADGRVVWQIPVEFSVRLPGYEERPTKSVVSTPPPAVQVSSTPAHPMAEANRPGSNYQDRSGYVTNFIPGHAVPLPKLTAAQQAIAAKNQQPMPDDDPYVLRYHHFSIVMNGKRRLAFYTACNIDGNAAKHVDRKTGNVTDLTADDSRIESFNAEGAEASEQWYDDPRLDPEEFAGADVYASQLVPGYPIANSQGRLLRMFQRGHLVRRMDPAWGSKSQALKADADTFHWTNCSPQVGFFNMGKANPDLPGTGGGLLWRAAENYVLRNAVVDKQRICCFNGPVFQNNDRRYRSVRVPGQFWKVIVWSEDGELRSVALLVNQMPVIEVWPESLFTEGGRSEAFDDPAELEKVEDFLSSIDEIEQLTDLDFGRVIKRADIRQGEARELLHDARHITTPGRRTTPRKTRR